MTELTCDQTSEAAPCRSRAALVLDRESDRHSPPFWVVLAQLTTAESPSWEAPAARLKRACLVEQGAKPEGIGFLYQTTTVV